MTIECSSNMATDDVTMDVTLTSQHDVDVAMRKRRVRNFMITHKEAEVGGCQLSVNRSLFANRVNPDSSNLFLNNRRKSRYLMNI